MSDLNQDRRKSNRSSISLSAVVKGRESLEEFWKENTEIVTVSRLGASFNLQRKSQVGRILSLIVKMPENLRCYDHDKNLYRVWGLVQHCSPVNQKTAFQVGIAFIGKFAPKSYLADPLKTYRIVGMDKDGFWKVNETKSPFVSRAHHRFAGALHVRLAVIDADGTESQVDTDAVTENISFGGAAVFSVLPAETGDAVQFTFEANGFTSLAVVRNRQKREGDRTTIHLEFAEPRFPVTELDLIREDDDVIETTEDTNDDAAVDNQEPGEGLNQVATEPEHAELDEESKTDQEDSDDDVNDSAVVSDQDDEIESEDVEDFDAEADAIETSDAEAETNEDTDREESDDDVNDSAVVSDQDDEIESEDVEDFDAEAETDDENEADAIETSDAEAETDDESDQEDSDDNLNDFAVVSDQDDEIESEDVEDFDAEAETDDESEQEDSAEQDEHDDLDDASGENEEKNLEW